MVRPRPVPPFVARRLLVQPDERLEHLLAIRLGDAGAVVLDRDLDHLVLLLAPRSRSSARSGRHCRPGCPGSGGTRSAAAAARRGRSMRDLQRHAAALGALPHALQHRLELGRLDAARGPRRGRSRDTPRPAWTSRRRPGAARTAPDRSALPSSSSSSCIRVSGVRRSWLTAASISVRWLMWRRIRWRIRLKACAAWRISSAPRGRKSPTSRPLPKLSAAWASCRIGRICRRRKKIGDRREHDRAADHPGEQEPGRRAGDPLARRLRRSADRA